MKIRFNTVKGKVLAGVAAVTLVSGMGFVAASTDAGTALGKWYDGVFGSAQSEMVKDVTKYGESKIYGLAKEYNGLRNDATASINTTRDTGETIAATNINAAKESHINSINIKEGEILGSMEGEFDAIALFGQGLINDAGEKALSYAKNDLKDLTDDKGEDAFEHLEKELDKVKNDAVESLKDEIESAQSTLQNELDNQQFATTKELKAAIDNKIIELRDLITDMKDEFVAAQQLLIQQEAQRLEDLAKEALDDVVAGINN